MSNSNNSTGFTLIELVVAMFIAGIASIAIFTAFKSQQKSYLVQDQVAEMQQNVRAAMDIMVREIRMAGYDPRRSSHATITDNSTSARIQVTMDINEDGDCDDENENITHGFSNENDADADGIADAGAADLGRNTGGGFQPLAENIQTICFAYAFDVNAITGNPPGDGILNTYNVGENRRVIWAFDSDNNNDLDLNLDTNGDGDIDEDDDVDHDGSIEGQALVDFGGVAIANVEPDQIRAVKIWILSRADKEDPDFHNTKTYVVGSHVITPDDGFRRRLLTTTVQCRNM